MQHLSRHNHRLLRLDTLLNDLTLDARDTLNGHFDTEVTTSNHDTIRSLDNFVDIVYTLLVFNLRNNLNVAIVRIEDVLHHLHIGSRAHERVSNKVNILLDSEKDIFVVTLRERRKINVLPRHIHTLMRAKHAVVLHFHAHSFTFDDINLHRDCPIIKKQAIAHFQILGNIRIRKPHFIVCSVHPRATKHSHLFTSLISDGGFCASSAHFRAFRVNQNTYMWRYGTNITDDFFDTFSISMRSVHTHHIHPCKEEFAKELFITAQVTDRANNLSFLHVGEELLFCSINIWCKFTKNLRSTTYVLASFFSHTVFLH